MPKAKTLRREFLQLAKTYRPGKDKIAGRYVSEKLDGTRCFWDGGLSRGVLTEQVPYASLTDPKTGRHKAKIKPVATGLWSRYGNPIMAPDWFLDSIPPIPIDGELWAGRGNFQLCRSICGGDSPDSRFDQIRYAAYGSPSIIDVLQAGEIKNSNFHATFLLNETLGFVDRMLPSTSGFESLEAGQTFRDELTLLSKHLTGDRIFVHEQLLLPDEEAFAVSALEDFLERVLDNGGEGVIIRQPDAVWTPKRVSALLKHKPFDDDEGKVVGFTSGRKTDKGSKHLGKIGALILDYKGKRLELSGLTDEEREFANEDMGEHATLFPGVDMPPSFQGKHFRVGDKVTFIYRELTDDGIPKEARYYRKRDEE